MINEQIFANIKYPSSIVIKLTSRKTQRRLKLQKINEIMRKENAYMIYNVDREDYWLIGQVVFPCKNTDTYEDAFNELKDISSPEVVDFIVDDNCLIDDLFDFDVTYKFKEVKREHFKVVYVFENPEGDEVKKEFKEEFIKIF